MSFVVYTDPFRSICLALGLVLLLSLVGCATEPSDPPTEILGFWATDAPRYRGRYFEIRDDAIVFGTGEFSAAHRHSLVGVETKSRPDGWSDCQIRYREPDGAVGEVDLSYRITPRKELQFAHRNEIWTPRKVQAENRNDEKRVKSEKKDNRDV
jgi:hypothetical protein